jgi:hypothetical protein
MSDDGAVFLGKPDRNKAGLQLRWLDCFENDMISMGVKRWGNKAEDSKLWAIIWIGTVAKL